MNENHGRGAFTLIEMLIVVAILAIMAATIIPQFADSTADAKQSTLDSNLRSLRSQVLVYNAHHGDYPAALSDLAAVSPAGYGPYIDAVPENPFTRTSTEKAVTSVPTGPDTGSDAGWLYLNSTGQVWANCAEGFP